MKVATDVTLKLHDLLDREVERHDHEWMETMQRLTSTERTEKRPVTIRSRDVVDGEQASELDAQGCFLDDFVHGTLEATNVQTTEEVRVKSKSSVTRKIQFTEAREEHEPCSDSSSGDETLSGESCTFRPGHEDLSGESNSRRPRDELLSGESRNITDKLEYNYVESAGSSDDSRTQSWENTSETTSNFVV